MSENEIIALLRLLRVPNIGDVTAKKLIASCGSPTAIFEDKPHHLLKLEGIGKATLKGLHDRKHRLAAEREFEFIKSNEIGVSCFWDADYPHYLKHCIDAPVLLFKKGNIALVKIRRVYLSVCCLYFQVPNHNHLKV